MDGFCVIVMTMREVIAVNVCASDMFASFVAFCSLHANILK